MTLQSFSHVLIPGIALRSSVAQLHPRGANAVNVPQRQLARMPGRRTVLRSASSGSETPFNPRVDRLRYEAGVDGKVVVSPSVAKADFWNLGEELSAAVLAGADWLHFSVQDGRMVPKISLGSPVIKSLRSRLPEIIFDVKLGVFEPEHRVAEFARAGADIISVHPEATLQLPAVLHKIRSAGCAAGVVLNPGTPVSTIQHVLEEIDVVVVMLVNPGWGGPKYMTQALEKIFNLRYESDRRELDLWIEVDGGVSSKNARALIDAGANALVAGGSVFSSEDMRLAIEQLKDPPPSHVTADNYI
mmetsp:Transcript_36813/g.103858  ORF Transcript_36813/g.103858 Transcript_36813/m.103858 type:complete len:302 (+) Transcript_36813:308-1213(+)|eukprot:CAMPEP_0117674384 /NCGR_PEP_ID=MMETSP0804-20121206/15005_1 /TAXON_ID=1074897 /ORGANISM="Tetraselmis astigmatica, Strain CCMP880" /LENGTH=301 /DNA_ID=CAMNT_0005483241 /DNA_START=210 /DNA_END=1115 /DNA_ORIENTATION=+